ASALLVLPAAATTEIYPLSLHDALPICRGRRRDRRRIRLHVRHARRARDTDREAPALARICRRGNGRGALLPFAGPPRHAAPERSEEHTSELQSRGHLVCRLLLEKKNIT